MTGNKLAKTIFDAARDIEKHFWGRATTKQWIDKAYIHGITATKTNHLNSYSVFLLDVPQDDYNTIFYEDKFHVYLKQESEYDKHLSAGVLYELSLNSRYEKE